MELSRADWAAGLPRLRQGLMDQWQLGADGPPVEGSAARVWPVRTADGEPAMLKLGWPHAEARYEHLGLRAWAGVGAVRLLRADPHRWALLLERAEPGSDLHQLPVLAACTVVAGLYGQLHRPALPQLDRLSEHAARWSAELPEFRHSPLVPRRFVEQAISHARDFAADPSTDGLLLHTDLHYANVLAGRRTPWLAIDPKPLSGDPAYEVAPLLWNRWAEAQASSDVRAALRERMFAVVDAAGLDEDRVRAWVVVRELVNAADVAAGLEPGGTERITGAITLVKAMQP